MQFLAFLDPEFWLIALRPLWPFFAVTFVLGFAAGCYLGVRFDQRRLEHWRTRVL